MLSRSRLLTQFTLAVLGLVGFIGQSYAQTTTTEQLSIDTPSITYSSPQTTTANLPGYFKEFDPVLTLTLTANGQPVPNAQFQVTPFQTTTANNLNWLGVRNPVPASDLGSGKYRLPITFEPANLPAGTYYGSVSVVVPQLSNSITIPVTFIVGQTNSLTISPSTLSFTYQPGGAYPNNQTLNIAPNGASYPFTVTASVTTGTNTSPYCSNFLLVSTSNTTPTTSTGGTTSATAATPINVVVNPSTLSQIPLGQSFTCTGNIAVASTAVNNNQAVNTPVTLTVSNLPTLTFSTQSLTFNTTPNSNTQLSQVIYVANAGTGLGYNVTVQQPTGAPANAIVVANPSGTTPGAIVVQVNTTGLAAGTYTGSITVTTTGAQNSTQVIPITINVSTTAQVTASPAQINFAYQTNTNIFPASQAVTLNSTQINVPLGYQVTLNGTPTGANGQQLFSVTPTSGSTTGGSNVVTVSVNQSAMQGINPGTYSTTLQVTASNQTSPFASLQIPIVLSVTTNAQITVNPSALAFTYQTFSPPPAAQTLQIGTTGTPFSFSVSVAQPSTQNGATVFSVVPNSGTAVAGSP